MKKAFLFTLILLMLVVALTSCTISGNGESTDTSTDATNEAQEAPKCKVTFSFNDEADGDLTCEVERGTGVQRPKDPQRQGYTLEGWYVGDEKWSFISNVVTYDITLYAKWTPTIYQIEYVGAIGGASTYTIEDELVLTGMVEGNEYVFIGWYADEALTKPVTKIEKGTTGNLKLYAKVEPVELPEQEPEFTFVPSPGSGYTLLSCNSEAEDITIPRAYKGRAVNRIAPYAFYNNKTLKSVIIPYGVTTIGEGAFSGCTSLEIVSLSGSIETIGASAFSSCKSLKSIELENVKVIGEYAFDGCSLLEEIVIPSSVTYVGKQAFTSNSKIIVYVEATSKPQGWDNSWEILNRPIVWGFDGEKYINSDGIRFAKTVDSAVITGYGFNEIIENDIEVIKNKKTVLEIPSQMLGLESIGICEYAFANQSALQGIVIPSIVKYIGEGAFHNSPNLKIYATATSKPEGWDSKWCSSMTSVAWGYTGLYGTNEAGYQWAQTQNGIVILGYTGQGTHLEIPGEINKTAVTAIGDNAFYSRVTFVSVVLPDSITHIGKEAFASCNNLKSIKISKSLKVIGERAFYYCMSLEEIELNAGLTQIGAYAFAYCTSLKGVDIPGSVLIIERYAFFAIEGLRVYCEETEKPQGWDENWISCYGSEVYWLDKVEN